jgi:uncharacterized membrane protein
LAVAIALQVGGSLQHQRFYVRRQLEVGGRKDDIVAFIRVLDHRVSGIVDEVGVIAGAADHHVGSGIAVEDVVAGVALDHVAQAVAVALQVGSPLQHEIFHVCRQPQMSG